MVYDIAIIGSGMAGMTACLYALRNNKHVLILEKESVGGQIAESPRVENYPTQKSISGSELADKLFEQIDSLGAKLEVEEVVALEKQGDIFNVVGQYNNYQARSVIIATGCRHRPLGLANEDKFVGKGVYYCAICDGPFFSGEEVSLIGDANSALQYALLLSGICKKVHMFTLFDHFFGEKSLQEAVLQASNIEITNNVKAVKLEGKDNLESITFKKEDGSTFVHKTKAVFVAIGQVPYNEPFKELVELDKNGYIIAGEDCKTKTPGLFVAGDCRTKALRQVTTAMSDGAVATMEAVNYLGQASENK